MGDFTCTVLSRAWNLQHRVDAYVEDRLSRAKPPIRLARSEKDLLLVAGAMLTSVGLFSFFPNRWFNQYMFFLDAFLILTGIVLFLRGTMAETKEE